MEILDLDPWSKEKKNAQEEGSVYREILQVTRSIPKAELHCELATR